MPARSRAMRISRTCSNAIALNSRGDFIYVAAQRRGCRSTISILKTLRSSRWVVPAHGCAHWLAGRVAAVPVHFDQAAEIVKQGNFKVLIEPWQEYKTLAIRTLARSGRVGRQQGQCPRSHRPQQGDDQVIPDGRTPTSTTSPTAFASTRPFPTPAKATDQTLKPIWPKAVGRHPRLAERRRLQTRVFQGPVAGLSQGVAPSRASPTSTRVVETRFVDQALQELG